MAKRLDDKERLLRGITEASFQRTVEGMLTAYGWRWFHAPDNKPSARGFIQNVKAGFPDIVAVRGSRVLYAELKREGPAGSVSPAQVEWHDALRAAGQFVYVWRPSDIPEIHKVLSPAWRPGGLVTHGE